MTGPSAPRNERENYTPAMQEQKHSYSTVWDYVRRVIEFYRVWIESRLGVPLSEAVVIRTEISYQDVIIERLTGFKDHRARLDISTSRLAPLLQSFEMPHAFLPILHLAGCRATDELEDSVHEQLQDRLAHSLEWVDGPVLMRLDGMNAPLIALCVPCHRGPDSTAEHSQKVVVISRTAVQEYLKMVKQLCSRDTRPKLIVAGESPQTVNSCRWEDLVLDESITSLLKSDFESFFERRAWFRKMRLPFRRGYLLHGPPGNGKSTAIRAMMTSRGLTAYTIRLFDDDVDDGDLENIFTRAANEAPAIVLLEDIDRSFPRTGQSKSKVSLQQLLNCLDGVASGEGVVTIATANEPTALDPAILRRPGRFDRVVLFSNPTPELRHKYFLQMHPSFAGVNLDGAVDQSDGFSFALLREAYIMAAQAGFALGREMSINDLLDGIRALRRTMLFGSLKGPSTGFAAPIPAARGKHE
jgi:hypothetical protein